MHRIALALATSTLALVLDSPAEAALNKCAAGKKLCVAKKAQALLKCHTLAEQTGADPTTDPKIQACLQKAHNKFDGGTMPSRGCFARLETKNPGTCLTVNDTTTLEGQIDTFVHDIVTALDPGYPAPVQNPCSAGKKKVTGKETAALLKCHVKNEKPPGLDPATFDTCLLKARAKFGTDFLNTQGKYGASCLTAGDDVTIADMVDGFVTSAVCGLDQSTCPSPTPTLPIPTCAGTPGPLPTPNPNHACCVAGPYCADIPPANGGDCFGGAYVVGGGFCVCGLGCYVPQ